MKGKIIALIIVLALVGGAYYLYEENKEIDTDNLGIVEDEAVDESMVGKWLEFDIDGESKDGTMSTIHTKGKLKINYVQVDKTRDGGNGAYLMQQEVTRQIFSGFGPLTSEELGDEKTETVAYWSDQDDTTFYYYNHSGTQSKTTRDDSLTTIGINGKNVKVYDIFAQWSEGDNLVTQHQYLGASEDDRWVVYRIDYLSTPDRSLDLFQLVKSITGTTVKFEYSLQDRWVGEGDDEEITTETELLMYSQGDIKVESDVSDSPKLGDEVTLTAKGSDFKGWYNSDMECISKSKTCKVMLMVEESDNVYYALGSTKYQMIKQTSSEQEGALDLLEAVGFAGTLSDGAKWTLVDYGGEITESWTGADPTHDFEQDDSGRHFLRIDDGDLHLCAYVFIDGPIMKTYEWKFNGKTYSAEIGIKQELFDEFQSMDADKRYCQSYSKYNKNPSLDQKTHDRTFATSSKDDAVISDLSSQMKSQMAKYGMNTPQERLGVVLAFCQGAIEYSYDKDTYGRSEYWAYPVETLFMGKGDCEDTTILFCAIAKDMGYESAYIIMQGHLAAGVSLSSFKDTGTSTNASKYLGWTSAGNYLQPDAHSGSYFYCETTGVGWKIGEMPETVEKTFEGILTIS